MMGVLFPIAARASIAELISGLVLRPDADSGTGGASDNLQTMTLVSSATNSNPNLSRGGGDITIVDGSALQPDEGPAGTLADIERPKNQTISIYVVREGDTIGGIAALFGVSPNTIRWANDIKGSTLRVGQTLTILPVTGLRHTVKKGDTLSSIAKQYHADAEEVAQYNGIEGALAVGSTITIPDGEVVAAPAPASTKPSTKPSVSGTSVASAGYYMRPLSRAVRTQGIHGYNAVDLAAPVGTPILASASGSVIVSREGGWNGGYGSYIVVEHGNGTQTLYSHASSVIVGVGERVVQGQVIGYVGQTGKATGPHLHFEIRNGPRNPF